MSHEETVRFIGRCTIEASDTGQPLDGGGYVALLLTGAERKPSVYLATAATLDELLLALRASDFAAKFADRPLELDAAPEPYFDHGPHRTARPAPLAFLERERVLTSLAGR